MLAAAVQLMDGTSLPSEISLKIGGVVVTCQADHISSDTDGIVLYRFKASRLSKEEKPKARYAVMQAALHDLYPGTSIRFEHVSLLTGERRPATINVAKLPGEIAKLEQAFADIAFGRFDPAPNDLHCPGCPYYFICPAHSAVSAIS
jgi:hypothetical protein